MPLDTQPYITVPLTAAAEPTPAGTAAPRAITPSKLSEAEQATLLRLSYSGIEAEIIDKLARREPDWVAITG